MIWCDHSNETSKVVLSQGTICILAFYEMNYELFVLTFAGAPSLIISQSAITDIQRTDCHLLRSVDLESKISQSWHLKNRNSNKFTVF